MKVISYLISKVFTLDEQFEILGKTDLSPYFPVRFSFKVGKVYEMKRVIPETNPPCYEHDQDYHEWRQEVKQKWDEKIDQNNATVAAEMLEELEKLEKVINKKKPAKKKVVKKQPIVDTKKQRKRPSQKKDSNKSK